MTRSIEPSSCPNAARPPLPFARTFSYSPSVSNTTSLHSCLGHSHRNGIMEASSTRSRSCAARSSFSFARRNTPSLSAFRSAGVFPSAVICSIFREHKRSKRGQVRHPPVLDGRRRGLAPAKPYTTRVDPRGQLASLSLLLDDPKALISLHHCLDLLEHVAVARGDKKTLRIGPDYLVVRGGQRNPLRTCVVGAFAHPVAKRHVVRKGTVYFFHALVDVAKQTLRPGAKRRIVKLPLLQNGRSLQWLVTTPGNGLSREHVQGRASACVHRNRDYARRDCRKMNGHHPSMPPTESSGSTLYGPQQSHFARFLERREQRRPDPGARELRRRLLAGLEGRVLEVGSGDGRSFEHYPLGVTALLAVEPDATARESAAERARTATVSIEIADGFAERLPADDGSFDAVVVMGVLCSVADPRVVLEELRRVLREGGELRFWEHVRSRHVLFRTLQRVLDRLFWTKALGGCETTRDTESAIQVAGFSFERLERGFHSSSLFTITTAPYIHGVARRV